MCCMKKLPYPVRSALKISGVSGQAIIRALLKGERDAKVLAKLRDPRCEASEEEIVQSLQGNWKEDLLFELQQPWTPTIFTNGK